MRGLLVIVAAASLSACTANIDLLYRPSGSSTYVQGAENVRLFVAPVADASGGVKDEIGTTGLKLQYARPMADGVREALETEAKRMGFGTAPSEDQADAVLRATLTSVRVWIEGLGSLPFVHHSKLLVDVVLEDKAHRRVWGGSVEGASQTSPGSSHGPPDWNGWFNLDLAGAMAKLGPALGMADLSKLRTGGSVATRPQAPAAPQSGLQQPVQRSDVEELPSARTKRPGAYAVVIGVGKYRRDLPPAEFADADARLMARYLAAQGVPDSNIVTLINDEAGRSDFEKYFERWLPNHVDANSEVFVYFSGHGAPNPKNGDAYLVPYDGDPVYLEETAYPLKKLYARLSALPAKKISVVMDSCFSGAGGRSVIAAGARPLVSVAAAEVPDKLTVITASSGEQTSNSYRAQGHGLFTYYFLKGLKEKGGDLRASYDYLKPAVSGYARRELNADQEPQWRGAR